MPRVTPMDGAVMENSSHDGCTDPPIWQWMRSHGNRRTPTGLQEDNDDFWLIFGRGSRGALRHELIGQGWKALSALPRDPGVAHTDICLTWIR